MLYLSKKGAHLKKKSPQERDVFKCLDIIDRRLFPSPEKFVDEAQKVIDNYNKNNLLPVSIYAMQYSTVSMGNDIYIGFHHTSKPDKMILSFMLLAVKEN